MDRQKTATGYSERGGHPARRAAFAHLISSLRQRPLLCLGLTLYWIWINIGFQSPLLFPLVRLSSEVTAPSIAGPIAAGILAYFVIGIWFRRGSRAVRQNWYLGLLAALMAVGVVANVLWLESMWPTSLLDAHVPTAHPGAITTGGVLLYVLSSLCTGTATACLCVEWGRVFGEHGPRQVLFHGVVSFLGAAVIVALISQLPPLVCSLAALALPAPMAWCVSRSQREFPHKTFFEHGLDATLHIPGKFLITALLHGLSLGILLGLFSVLEYENNAVLLISYAGGAMLLLVTALAVMMDFNHLIYQIGFFLVALGAMLIAFLYPAFQWGASLQLAGFCYLHLLIWGLCSYLIRDFRLPATWVIAWPTCSFMFGQFAGIIISSLTTRFTDAAQVFPRLFLVLSFVMLMAALFLMSHRNYQTAWGLARPGSIETSDSSIAAALQLLAASNELSQREMQAFSLLARGKNRRSIAQALFISEETAKSHAHSIYRKLGVHSQQELMKVCEQHACRLNGPRPPAPGDLPTASHGLPHERQTGTDTTPAQRGT